MAGFMEVSFPVAGLSQAPFPGSEVQFPHPAAVATSHWSFQSLQNGYAHSQSQEVSQHPLSRKRTSGQAFSYPEPRNLVKRSRPEQDMSFDHGVQQSSDAQPVALAPFLPNISSINEQTCAFPSSYLEHQNVVHAEKRYQSSLLEALLYEVHGC